MKLLAALAVVFLVGLVLACRASDGVSVAVCAGAIMAGLCCIFLGLATMVAANCTIEGINEPRKRL